MEAIDFYIRKGCRLAQQATSESDEKKKVELERESDKFWTMAKALGKPGVTEDCYENLANAVVKQAIFDYIGLLNTVRAREEVSATCNKTEIRKFAKDQMITTLNLSDLLDQIDRCYEEKFIPYVSEHRAEIVSDYKEAKKKHKTIYEFLDQTKHRCPFCQNGLYPKAIFVGKTKTERIGYNIVCRNCGMSY